MRTLYLQQPQTGLRLWTCVDETWLTNRSNILVWLHVLLVLTANPPTLVKVAGFAIIWSSTVAPNCGNFCSHKV